jgi:tetratricopeptide (TPR) repeat protein
MNISKRFSLIFFLFGVTLSVSAQQESTVKVLTEEEVNAAKSEFPVKALDKFNEGISAFEQKNYSLSVQLYSEAIAIAPLFAKAYLNRAYAYLELKELTNAKSDFIKVTELDQAVHQAYFEMAMMASVNENKSEAIELYGKAIDANPKEAKYFYQRAVLEFGESNFEKAKKDLTAAITLKKDYAFAYNDRGSVNRELGDLSAAIQDYQVATVLDPKSKIAFNNLGSAYRKKGEFDNAIMVFTESIKIDNQFYLAYNNRGLAKYEKGDYEGAIKDFQEATRIKSDYAYAFNNIASAYFKLKNYKEAVSACNKAIAIDAEYGYAYYNRGLVYEMMREELKACQDWEKAAELGVESANTYYNNSDCKNQ